MWDSLVTAVVIVSKLCHIIFYPTPVVHFFIIIIITGDIIISFVM